MMFSYFWNDKFENLFFIKTNPGIYSVRDVSEVVYIMGVQDGTLNSEKKDISVKIKSILTRFVGIFGTLTFDEKSFLNTFLGCTPYWN